MLVSIRSFFAISFCALVFNVSAATYPSHVGQSPWGFDSVEKPSDTWVVNDRDSNSIDKYMFRYQGSIIIDVPIRRYVWETDASGHLKNVSDLIARGLVSEKMKIILPAFDVDEGVFPVGDCDGDQIPDTLYDEVDEVYFNGEKIGKLEGQNNVWFQQVYTVDISTVKFPSSPGATATNRIEVKIDVDNQDVVLSSGAVGCNVWATSIDWVGLQYDATDPVVMVHGIRSSGPVFDNFKTALNDNFMASDNSITLNQLAAPNPLPPGCPEIPYNNSLAYNIAQLLDKIPAIAEKFGADSIHMVAHSKGGLDSRGFLQGVYASKMEVQVGTMSGQPVKSDFEPASLITLNTPHQGSVLAKYGIESRQLTWPQASQDARTLAAKGLEGPYYCDLLPARASQFVAATNLPSSMDAASTATDADVNGDRELTGAEGDGLVYQGTRLYQIMGRAADVVITVRPRNYWIDEVVITETPNGSFLLNDAIVTQQSAGYYLTYDVDGLNHVNVHAEQTGRTIAEDSQNGGFVNWGID